MSRTYSLARLMRGITLFCMLCGLVTNFPWISLYATPTVIVCISLLGSSVRPIGVLIVSLLGAIVFFVLFSPAEFVLGTRREAFVFEFITLGVTPAIGAFLFGGAFLADEHSRRQSQP